MKKIVYRSLNNLARYGWPITLALLAAFALGFTWSSSDKLYNNIRLFDRVTLMVSENYVEEVDDEKMVKVGIDAMLSKLDNYTKFLRGADYVRLRQETESQFEGIGASMEFHRDTLTIVSVVEGAPGHRMGLKPGDRVLKIDSTSTLGLDAKQVRMLMWGPADSRIELSIYRPGGKERLVSITREDVEIQSIPYYSMISDKIGYIRVTRFSENCLKDFKNAVKDMKKEGMNSLVLDLRGNPGGLLLEAVEIAGLFLPEDSKIVETRGRNGTLVNPYRAGDNSIFFNGGLAVIVDEQTASAAEILAGAIQDYDRGIIIGTDTYGKGLVQQVLQFSDNSALKITTSKYYLPSGRCLQKPDWSTFELLAGDPKNPADSLYYTGSGRPVYGGGGIMPDIYLENSEESDYVTALKQQACFFDFAIEYLRTRKIGRDFRVDGRIMSRFKKFVADRGFAFLDEDRIAFEEFKGKISVLDNETKNALRVIEERLNSKETWQFDNHYSEIMTVLNEEIVLRSGGEKALYEKIWLKDHAEITEAKEVLSDSRRYLSILASR
ncbi:MAG: PDZ domain-containing protein [Candidatus Zixiibacteriota bacterium]|nr:MAG: PDZ domain-containing protein [candidate division Zixibacteria bacterium]